MAATPVSRGNAGHVAEGSHPAATCQVRASGAVSVSQASGLFHSYRKITPGHQLRCFIMASRCAQTSPDC